MAAGNWGNSSTWTICLILWGIKLNMYKILLVDDEILVRDAIRENIDWKGLDCELVGDCENGRQAVEFVQNHVVDIVLTDICMPYIMIIIRIF